MRRAHISDDLPLYLTGAAAAATVVSIAAFESLMALALVAVLVKRATGWRDWRWPPITLPVCLWMIGTLISATASGDVRAALPQVKKFYVFLMLFLVFAVFRKMSEICWLVLGWALGASLSALWSFEQLAQKYRAAQAAQEDFYLAYVAQRITGFMDHWMTFSGQMMMAFLLIAGLIFFSWDSQWGRRWTGWLLAAALLIGFALVAAYTRSMWLGALAGSVYLVWIWRRWVVLAIPAMIGILLLANPFEVRERAISAIQPHGDVDSNEHRVVTRRIGWEMIKAHPWLGVGPEEVGKQYESYVPADVARPLPTGYYGHLHNIYIHYAAERGVPTALALMWILGQALFDFARTVRRLPAGAAERWVLHGAIAVMIAVMLSGWYELNLGDSEVLGMFLAVLGCGYAAVMSVRLGVSETERAPISPMWAQPQSNI